MDDMREESEMEIFIVHRSIARAYIMRRKKYTARDRMFIYLFYFGHDSIDETYSSRYNFVPPP